MRPPLTHLLGAQIIFLIFLRAPVHSQETLPTPENTPAEQTLTNDAATKADQMTLSMPETSPDSVTEAAPKPSQGEGEKAPLQEKPAAVPEFSLPEVVITGENELTIGAERLKLREENVDKGGRDLSVLNRSSDDLPGLNKTFTALATEEAGPSKETAFVLHLGGGLPGTYGGWGFLGQDFKDAQLLLSGNYSAWGGQATGGGFDGDRRYGCGGSLSLFPSAPLRFNFSGSFTRIDAELPYQASLREIRDGLDLEGTAHWKISEMIQAQGKVSYQSLSMEYWNMGLAKNWAKEGEVDLKVMAEDGGDWLDRFVLEGGWKHADSDISLPPSSAYDWGWVSGQAFLKHGENLSFAAKLQAQGGVGLSLPLRFFPMLNFNWRVFETSQLNLHWKTDRFVESLYNTMMETEHTALGTGYPSPTEVAEEWSGRLTQKLLEGVILTFSGSTVQIKNYNQWTDLNPAVPTYIQGRTSLSLVRINKGGGGLQWNIEKDLQVTASYQWTSGTNEADSLQLTALPEHKGVFSIYRGDENLETRLSLTGASESFRFDSLPGTLPSYFTLDLDATYRLTKTTSLWFNGDNLLGNDFERQSGYLEPRFHVRAGVEVIF